MLYRFVDTVPGGPLLERMLKGGLEAKVAGFNHDEVFVIVNDDEEWADVDAWVRAIEAHYACVFNDSAN